MNLRRQSEQGQTLIALLIFMLVAMTITLAAAAVAIINLQANSSFDSGQNALVIAESGAENAIEQLERNPSYSGETLNVGSGSATITVSGSGTLTITSVGTEGDFQRTVTATVTVDSGNDVSLTSWSETP